MDLFRVRRVSFQVAGDAIVESHAEREQQIGFLDGGVHPGFAVHTHHAQVQRMGCGKRANAEQRHGDRNFRLFGEGLHLAHGAG